ncbi:hypothetical protein V496_03246, partial [Pseudogymnoascus sp. VKM F-4515 (FW-2607)]
MPINASECLLITAYPAHPVPSRHRFFHRFNAGHTKSSNKGGHSQKYKKENQKENTRSCSVPKSLGENHRLHFTSAASFPYQISFIALLLPHKASPATIKMAATQEELSALFSRTLSFQPPAPPPAPIHQT